MSNCDELYDLCTLRDNLKKANSNIQEDEVRNEYSSMIEEILDLLKMRIDDLEDSVKKEKREEERHQEREYREMVGI